MKQSKQKIVLVGLATTTILFATNQNTLDKDAILSILKKSSQQTSKPKPVSTDKKPQAIKVVKVAQENTESSETGNKENQSKKSQKNLPTGSLPSISPTKHFVSGYTLEERYRNLFHEDVNESKEDDTGNERSKMAQVYKIDAHTVDISTQTVQPDTTFIQRQIGIYEKNITTEKDKKKEEKLNKDSLFNLLY